MSASLSPIDRTVLRLPRSAYLPVAFVTLCVTAIVRSPWQTLVYLIPLAAAFYVARTRTIVDADGLTAQVLFGARTIGWDDLAGLRLDESGAVYAVDRDGGQVKLPCVRSTKLAPLITASGGRIPDPGA